MRRMSAAVAVGLMMACGGGPQGGAAGPDAAQKPGSMAVQDCAPFVNEQVELLKPLVKEANLSWYEASVAGTDEAFGRSKAADDALNRFLADRTRFARVQSCRDNPEVADAVLKRQLEVAYRSMLGKQVEPAMLEKITALEKQVEQAFNNYRGQAGGKEVTQNEINQILRTSLDSRKLKEAWEAQKGVGPVVAAPLKELVKLRNEVAKQLGFRDYYALKIAESEQNEEQLLALFDELDRLTREPFLKAKAEVDKRLAKRLKLKPDKLMPWHYQNAFFQETPGVFNTGLDAIYKKQDTLQVCQSFLNGIGLEVDDIIARSDLYEKKGKTPHAFSVDIDRAGDIRVLANIVPGEEWQGTMVHELGHAVYDKYVDPSLPWLLREAAHPLTTEGMAMMLDHLVGNPYWAESLKLMDAKARAKALAEAQAATAFNGLLFSRWTQVMLRFERGMYGNPDQDLSDLWWQLVGEYQALPRPPERKAPDYASKIHLVVAPVYYHNYMMGELFASQVHQTIAGLTGKSVGEAVYVGDPKVGEFLKTKVFAAGAMYSWNEFTRHVTGSELSAKAFSERYAPAN